MTDAFTSPWWNAFMAARTAVWAGVPLASDLPLVGACIPPGRPELAHQPPQSGGWDSGGNITAHTLPSPLTATLPGFATAYLLQRCPLSTRLQDWTGDGRDSLPNTVSVALAPQPTAVRRELTTTHYATSGARDAGRWRGENSGRRHGDSEYQYCRLSADAFVGVSSVAGQAG